MNFYVTIKTNSKLNCLYPKKIKKNYTKNLFGKIWSIQAHVKEIDEKFYCFAWKIQPSISILPQNNSNNT